LTSPSISTPQARESADCVTQQQSPRSEFGRSRAIALSLCAFAYLYVFPYQSRLNNPNENVRFYMTAALVEEGRYEIDGMRARWGWVNDAATRDGHFYSVKAPGSSWLGVPGYALYYWAVQAVDRPFDRIEALWVCRVTAAILPTLLWLWFFHGWLDRRSRHPALRDAVFFSVALGSLLYGYGLLFVSHTLSAAAAFSAFALLFDAREKGSISASRAFAAGMLTAGVTLLEYPGLPCSLALAVYAAVTLLPAARRRGLIAFAAGGLVPVLAMMHFQWRAFGSPFTPGHLMVESAGFRAAHHQGLYGAVGPSLKALHGLLLDLGAGLFPLTPVLMLAPWGLWLLLRNRERRTDGLCVAAVLVFTVLAIASMNNWRGGWTIGPRYLALCVPFAAFCSLLALERIAVRRPSLAIALAVGATATAMLASGLPSAYYPYMPPEITRPLPQLFAVLIAHDYAPRNAGALVSVFGSASMAPLAVVALAALALCLRSVAGMRSRATVAAGALLCCLALATPLWIRPKREPGVQEAVAFITRRWTPAGHDAAARLAAEIRAQDQPAPSRLERLSRLYLAEGREREAKQVSSRGASK
jgi:hypothetical protein